MVEILCIKVHIHSDIGPGDTQKDLKNYQNLTNVDCIRSYGQVIDTQRKNVVVVPSALTANGSSLIFADEDLFHDEVTPGTEFQPFDW